MEKIYSTRILICLGVISSVLAILANANIIGMVWLAIFLFYALPLSVACAVSILFGEGGK